MKNQRAHSLPSVAVALILSTWLGASASPAQNAQAANRYIVSVDFNGGSLEDFVGQLKAAGENINIVIPPEAEEVKVPAVSLKNVGVEAALEAVATISLSDLVRVTVNTKLGTGEPIYAVRVDLAGPRPVQADGEPEDVRVFSIRALTESMPGDPDAAKITLSSDTILTAIDTGLDVVGEGRVTIRYHEDSGLLFVKGTRTQINLIERTISNMASDLEIRRISARRVGAGGRPGGGDR